MSLIKFIGVLITLVILFSFNFASADKPNDTDALRNIDEGKVVWDINIANPIKLLKILNVVEETYNDLSRQGVTPDMVFAFRGPSVKLVSSQPLNLTLEEENAREEVVNWLQKFRQKSNVNMESCSVATRLLGVDNETIIPEVNPVGNTFVSLIGYQKKGYALIPLY